VPPLSRGYFGLRSLLARSKPMTIMANQIAVGTRGMKPSEVAHITD
jgi:hypothetical protein